MSAFLISYLGAVAALASFGIFVVIYDAITTKKEGKENGKRENRED